MPATIWWGGAVGGAGGFYRCIEAQLQQCASGLRVFHYTNVDPSSSSLPPRSIRLLSPSLNTKPQIGWDALQEGCNHKPHSASDVMCWRDACHMRQPGYKVTTFLCFQLKVCSCFSCQVFCFACVVLKREE